MWIRSKPLKNTDAHHASLLCVSGRGGSSAAAIDELYLLTDLAYSVLINGWNFMGTEYRVTNDRSWDSSKPYVATEYTNIDEDGTIYVGPTVHMDHAIAQAWIEAIEKAGVTFADGARW